LYDIFWEIKVDFHHDLIKINKKDKFDNINVIFFPISMHTKKPTRDFQHGQFRSPKTQM